jgi:hypothetical protein
MMAVFVGQECCFPKYLYVAHKHNSREGIKMEITLTGFNFKIAPQTIAMVLYFLH